MTLIKVTRSLAIRRIVGWDGGGDPTRAVEPLDPNSLGPRDVAAVLREATRMAERRPEKRNLIREATLRANTITPAEVTEAADNLIKIALIHMPNDRKRNFVEKVMAYLRGDYKP
jgi:hypothetical protein